MNNLVALLPSPPIKGLDLGPFQVRAYGLAIAIGALTAVAIARRRWKARGGDGEDIAAIATWAVPAGLVGARLYHVATDHQRFTGQWWKVIAIWEGGLGIPGGLLVGVLAGAMVAHRRGLPLAPLLDAVAPAIPIAQAIGRLGNWFNQELFGRPSALPWAVEIDPSNRPDGYVNVAAYHPTFLYEGLWNLALATLLVWLGRGRLRPGQLFALYVAGYAAGRLWIEALRIDEASLFLSLRINIWVSGIALLAALTVLFMRRHARADQPTILEYQPGT